MKLLNELVKDSIQQLDNWIEINGWAGYDLYCFRPQGKSY